MTKYIINEKWKLCIPEKEMAYATRYDIGHYDIDNIHLALYYECDKKDERIEELEIALHNMLAVFEYEGQSEGANVACWDANVALGTRGYNKTIKEIDALVAKNKNGVE